jgi:hypothetical protein
MIFGEEYSVLKYFIRSGECVSKFIISACLIYPSKRYTRSFQELKRRECVADLLALSNAGIRMGWF